MDFVKKRSLVIGASGQVGSALFGMLKGRGAEVFGTSSKENSGYMGLDLFSSSAAEKIMRELKPDIVYLCAAFTNVEACETDVTAAYALNRDVPSLIGRTCGKFGAKLVYYSTEYVFDGRNGPYSEDDAPNPLSVYGKSKYEGEKAVLAVPGALSIRTTVVYGFIPGGKNFLMQVLENGKSGREMRVPYDQISSPTNARELAGFSIELAEKGASGIFNVAGDGIMSRFDFAAQICDVFGIGRDFIKPVATSELGQKAPRPLRAGLKIGKLASYLGRRPMKVREALVRTKEYADGNTA